MAIVNRTPYRLAIDALGLQPGDKVLDLGFGPGRGLAALLARTPRGRVYGIDHSSRMLAQAAHRNRAALASQRLELVRGTFGALPWPDGAFDRILLVNVVYFFDRNSHDMAEAHRVLRPGGRLAIYATDRATMRKWRFSGPDTHTTFDERDVAALLESAGFERTHIHTRRFALPLGMNGIIAIAEKSEAGISRQRLRVPSPGDRTTFP